MNRPLIAPRKSARAAATDAPRLNSEIEILTRYVWAAEGCPVQGWSACRREVELQFHATRPLLVAELGGEEADGATTGRIARGCPP